MSQITLPAELIVYISGFTNNNLLKKLNKEIYLEIVKDEVLDEWKDRYIKWIEKQFINKDICIEPIKQSKNWKKELLRVIETDGLDKLWENIAFSDEGYVDICIINGGLKYRYPKELWYMKDIIYLTLKDCQLNKVSKKISNLQYLTILDLSYNEIEVLPDEICELKNLIELNFEYNIIDETTIPKNIFLLKKICKINLNDNELNKIPYQLTIMENLLQLYLRNNHIIKLPPKLNNLVNLTDLNLEQNEDFDNSMIPDSMVDKIWV